MATEAQRKRKLFDKMSMDPQLCWVCEKHTVVYEVFGPRHSIISSSVKMGKIGWSFVCCRNCIYQDIDRIYEEWEREKACRIDYCTAPERVRLLWSGGRGIRGEIWKRFG